MLDLKGNLESCEEGEPVTVIVIIVAYLDINLVAFFYLSMLI
jgi:hypothetical protein